MALQLAVLAHCTRMYGSLRSSYAPCTVFAYASPMTAASSIPEPTDVTEKYIDKLETTAI